MQERTVPNNHGPGDRPIVLTTDFGLADPYAGVMKGVVLGINPWATVIDLTHQIQPQNILQAAFVLGVSYRFFPTGAIHVVVVDPKVGTPRRAVLLVTPLGRFLAPDNGVLSQVLRDYLDRPPEYAGRVVVPDGLGVYNLTNPRYWLQPVSQTFHGRDVFAPVAAHLSLGVAPDDLGEQVKDVAWLPAPRPVRRDNSIEGEVIIVDHFGNLVTNIPASELSRVKGVQVAIKGRRISKLSRTFNEDDGRPPDDLVALLGSNGLLEIACPNGSAAAVLRAGVGELVRATLSGPG